MLGFMGQAALGWCCPGEQAVPDGADLALAEFTFVDITFKKDDS